MGLFCTRIYSVNWIIDPAAGNEHINLQPKLKEFLKVKLHALVT